MGALPANSRIIVGNVIFKNIDLLKLNDRERKSYWWRRIVYIPQASMNSLNPFYKIGYQIAEAVQACTKVTRPEAYRKSLKLLADFQLGPEVMRMYPHQLSGGMRQRAVMAMGLAGNPELLILDEPTTALDVVTEKQLLDNLVTVQMQQKFALIIISHDLSLVGRYTEELLVMQKGMVVERGFTEAVLKNPAHQYTKLLVNSYPHGRISKNDFSRRGIQYPEVNQKTGKPVDNLFGEMLV